MHTRTDILLKLLEEIGPSLHALLTRLTLRHDVAEDLMQDLFIKLVNSKGLEKVENLSAYARTVATNLAFDWRRKKSYRTHAHTDNIPEPAADQKDQLTLLQEDEQLRRIMEAADRLSKTQRQVFVLRYIEQQSFEQIAEAVGKTPHHVRALSSRALTRVRALCAKKSVRPMAQGGWS